MQPKKCYIAGAMEFSHVFSPERGSVVIAADGGYERLKKISIEPDIVIGDFDSSREIPTGENIFKYQVQKDDTDMMLAVKKGLELGCSSFYLYGGFGGRFDHTFANIQTLCYIAESGGRGYLIGEGECITAVKDGRIAFLPSARGNISVFSVCAKSFGVYESGLKYSLKNAELEYSFPMGVSNCFIGEESEICVENGTLVIVWNGNPEDIKNDGNTY